MSDSTTPQEVDDSLRKAFQERGTAFSQALMKDYHKFATMVYAKNQVIKPGVQPLGPQQVLELWLMNQLARVDLMMEMFHTRLSKIAQLTDLLEEITKAELAKQQEPVP